MKRIYFGLQILLMFNAFGGIFSKNAANAPFLSFEYIKNFMGVFIILGIYAIFWQKILKKLPLTVAMANKSVTVIWGMIYGWLFFQETITIWNIIGAIVVISGILIVVDADKEESCT